MPGATTQDPATTATTEIAAHDPLAPLLSTLAGLAEVPPDERLARVREALPTTLGDLADGNRRLRDALHRREALIASAAAELRHASGLLAQQGGTDGAAAESARLRRLAEDLERALRPTVE